MTEFTLTTMVLLPFLGAVMACLLAKLHKTSPAWVAGITTLLALSLMFSPVQAVFSGITLQESLPWIPSLGIFLAFRGDGLSLLFAGLIVLIGLMVVIYAAFYLSHKYSWGRFYASLLLFMGSMLGVVLSENLLVLVVFWELTSITSFLLISFWQDRPESRQGARMALAVTGLGGMVLMVGVLILGQLAGSFMLSEVFTWIANHPDIKDTLLFKLSLVCVLIGAMSKSAQFPFHFWLPQAMAAPTPVSAYLHSATMVKAGLFLLARLTPIYADSDLWFEVLTTAGLFTMLLGAYGAIFKADLKALLAYSTISNLGLVTLLLGMGSPLAMVAALLHIINHAFYKAPLFMIAGTVDHQSGCRDINRLGGLFPLMPITGALAIVAVASMAGLPLLNGFISKELLFERTVHLTQNGGHPWFPVIAVLAACFTVAYSAIFLLRVFFGAPHPAGKRPYPKIPTDPHPIMTFPVFFFVAGCVLMGLFPSILNAVLSVAVSSALQQPAPPIALAIWHGANAALFMSSLAFIGGVTVYWLQKPLTQWHAASIGHLVAADIFHTILRLLVRGSINFTQFCQRDSLRVSVAVIVLFSVLVSGGSYFFTSGYQPFFGSTPLLPLDAMTVSMFFILMLATILTVAWHEKRMQALISLGVVGLMVSLLFLKFSAPDLALTQLSVEAITTVLLMLALFLFPKPLWLNAPLPSPLFRGTAFALAMLCGIGITLLTLAVLTHPFESIAPFYLIKTLPEGGGANAVNVILVDFRGIDTMGEITVLAMAGLGVYALLSQVKLKSPRLAKEPNKVWGADRYPIILRTMARLIFPFLLLFAIFVLLRGHNQPGGGFIAGLITALALMLQYLANGWAWTHARMRVNMLVLMGTGLFFAVGTGVGSLWWGFPFLTSHTLHLTWPLIGDFELPSAALFDFGVFLVVTSTTVIALVKLGVAREK
jgi:multicomponent K+:H+ antiporter subunit A